MGRIYLEEAPPPRGPMPAYPRNREKDPEAYDAAKRWQKEQQNRKRQLKDESRRKSEEKAKRNEEAAKELNRRKDVVMYHLSDIANSTPFTGDEYVEAAETQRQEKINKWHDLRNGFDAAMTVGEGAAATYGLIRGLAHLRRLSLRAATRSIGQSVSNETMRNLAKWNRYVDKIDTPQATMNVVGSLADGYQWVTADNSFDKYENGLETGANAAGFVGGMNWFRNLPALRRIGGITTDNILDGLGYGAAGWDIIKNIPPLSGALSNIREQSKQKE